jgi:hypothetical protein
MTMIESSLAAAYDEAGAHSGFFCDAGCGSSPDDWICVECCAAFPTEAAADAHARKAHGSDDDWLCVDCSAAFATERAADQHWDRVHFVGPRPLMRCWYCVDCNGAFRTERATEQHWNDVHGRRPARGAAAA